MQIKLGFMRLVSWRLCLLDGYGRQCMGVALLADMAGSIALARRNGRKFVDSPLLKARNP